MAYTTINKSTDYFNTKLYTGTGSTNALTGVGFQPDFTWIKSRSDALSHALFDAVRGTTKVLNSNATSAEYTNTDTLTAFGSDGFTVGSNTGVNASGETRVAWNWLANGAGSSNTDGSITSTVSANTTSGFSVVSYTGTGANATVGHGLGSVPAVIIIKRLNVVASWRIFHQAIGNTKNLVLNTTAGEETSSTMWNNTSPTSTTFSLGSYDEVNGSSAPHIAYCFAEKTGYSKFGSYIGNGADGSTTNNFIYTGFKPTFVMVKRSNDSSQQWTICDTTRSPSNVSGSMEWLFPDNSGAETDEDLPYMLSNGFMPRTGHTYMNRSGFSYIYMAFGQSLIGSNNVPCTAR